jgi:hypothetical protein
VRSIISSEVQYKFSIILVISLIVIDVMIANFFDLLDSTFGGESIMGAAIFTLIAVALYAPLLSLLRYAGKVSESVRAKDSSFDKLHKIVNISQLVFAGIIAILISLMFSVSQYYIAFLVAATILSQGLTATILGGFWFRMSSWYKSSQRNKMLLLYGLAGLMVAISSAVNAFTYSAILLSDDRQWRGPMSNVSLVEIRVEALPFIDSLLMIGFLPLIAAYVLAWGGSVMVLKHQGKQFGRLRLWSLLAAPLVIYVIAISQDFFLLSVLHLSN